MVSFRLEPQEVVVIFGAPTEHHAAPAVPASIVTSTSAGLTAAAIAPNKMIAPDDHALLVTAAQAMVVETTQGAFDGQQTSSHGSKRSHNADIFGLHVANCNPLKKYRVNAITKEQESKTTRRWDDSMTIVRTR